MHKLEGTSVRQSSQSEVEGSNEGFLHRNNANNNDHAPSVNFFYQLKEIDAQG